MNEIFRYFVWQKMNYCFVLIFTFQLALSYENPSKIDKIKWKNITKFSCKRINCPPVEEPTCVRMRHKKIGSKTKDIYIMLLNKCEMEYMKCHQDYQATEVSMKNCGHYEKSLKSSGKIRAKRETLRGIKEPANQTAKKQIDKQVNMTLKQNPPKSILGEISIFGSPFDLGQHLQQNKGGAVRSTSKPSAADAKNKDEDSTERNEDDEISNEVSEREDSENTVDVNEDAELITLEKNSEESDTEETTLSPLLDDTTKNGDELSIKESEEVGNKDSSETNKPSEDSSSSSKSDHYEVQLESNEEESQNTQADSKDESGINVKTEEDENIDEDTTEDPKINEKTEGDSTEDSKISEKTEEDNKEDPKINEKSEGDNEEDTKISDKTEEDKEDSKVNINSGESSESHSEHVSEDSTEMEDTKPTKTTETPKQSANYKNTDDYDLMEANEGVNFEEYGKECPTECPAAEVMLCGRCKDGVYRTFMSVCHLRMFNCKHPDEKVELVTRYPCILSAPYLNEAPSPRGSVSQPGDKDLVLQYIRCREKSIGKNGNDDPECSFGTKI